MHPVVLQYTTSLLQPSQQRSVPSLALLHVSAIKSQNVVSSSAVPWQRLSTVEILQLPLSSPLSMAVLFKLTSNSRRELSGRPNSNPYNSSTRCAQATPFILVC
jgi:hypothetical protein